MLSFEFKSVNNFMRTFFLTTLLVGVATSQVLSQYLGEDFYAVGPRIRFVSSNFGPTGNFTTEDKFSSYIVQPFSFYNSDRKVMLESMFTISSIINMVQPALKYRFHRKPGARFTQNYNRIGNDINLFTLRVLRNFNSESDLKFGLGLDMEWNVEGVRTPDYISGGDNSEGKMGNDGFGSGMYKSRGRFYFGPALGLTHFLAEDRLTYSLIGSLGLYSGGFMSITKFTLTYALSKRLAVQGFVGYRFKNFKGKQLEYFDASPNANNPIVMLQGVKVNTLDGGFTLLFRFNSFGGLGKGF